MVELTLIRHGQAQTGAQDEASYDNLSDLGHRQARWLGEALRDGGPFERIISGDMKRQVQTAEGLALGVHHSIDPRLNELDYFGLAASLKASHGVDIPDDIQSFARHVPQVLDVWRQGGMNGDLETYDEFCSRIMGALHNAAGQEGRTVLVTSTGVIATLSAIALGLDMVKKTKLFLRVMNTSVHKFELLGDELHLTQFGAVPHLEHPDRAYAQTYG
ncbi:histidine phosphatase family protein [Profundibacter amoris]|uniref:histidine phosphatase family protein n=1 Tax=Profundibacter amoris TaxID=2171755 RepID=UPI0013C2C6BA|nr:histidine phosphatase family protein [Profundibacter amoris]